MVSIMTYHNEMVQVMVVRITYTVYFLRGYKRVR